MKSIENRLFLKIFSHGRGWVFSGADFVEEFNSSSIDKSLSLLAKENKIRRVMRGIYDYPKFSQLLSKQLSPNLEQTAYALSRKFNWRIEPSGETALYLLGVSTQVPGRYIYLSDGPNRIYRVENSVLEFKKTALKEIGFKYPKSSLLVQAIKSLGKENVSQSIIKKLASKIDSNDTKKILNDTKTASAWIYQIIKQICNQEVSNG